MRVRYGRGAPGGGGSGTWSDTWPGPGGRPAQPGPRLRWGRGGAFGAHSNRVGRQVIQGQKGAPGGLPPHLPRSWRPGSAWRAGPGPAIPPQHIWLPFPECRILLSPGSQGPPPAPARAPAWGRTSRFRGKIPSPLGMPHPSACTPPGTRTPPETRTPLVPSPFTHYSRKQGAWELSPRCSCRSWSWSWRGNSCRRAGSWPWGPGPPQVSDLLPRERSGLQPHTALPPKRRQLVLLKSLNLVPKFAQPNGTRRLHARPNGKAVGGDALPQVQWKAAEAGPAAGPTRPPAGRLPAPGRMLRPGAGPGRGLGARGGRGSATRGGSLPRMRPRAQLRSAVGTGLRRVLISSPRQRGLLSEALRWGHRAAGFLRPSPAREVGERRLWSSGNAGFPEDEPSSARLSGIWARSSPPPTFAPPPTLPGPVLLRRRFWREVAAELAG